MANQSIVSLIRMKAATAKRTRSQKQGIPPSVVFAAVMRREGLPLPELEYRFHPVRKWRFDYAWPEHKIALEVEGGLFIPDGGGRHNRGASMLADFEKYNQAAILGWRVLKAIPDQRSNKSDRPHLCSMHVVNLLRQAFCPVQHCDETLT